MSPLKDSLDINMLTKQEIRKKARRERVDLSISDSMAKNMAITNRVIRYSEFRDAHTVLLYHSINNEVDTSKIFQAAIAMGIQVGFPRIEGEYMRFYQVTKEEDLVYGFMGIMEPVPDESKLIDTNDAVVLAPGVAFDEKCNRTGYGRGFYDRYFREHPGVVKVGLAYDLQVYPEIETDEYDVPLDFIITESRIIVHDRFRNEE